MQFYFNLAHYYVQKGDLVGVTTFLEPIILLTGAEPKIPKEMPIHNVPIPTLQYMVAMTICSCVKFLLHCE